MTAPALWGRGYAQCLPCNKQTSKPSVRTHERLCSHPPQGLQRVQTARGQAVTLQGPGAEGRAQIPLKGHHTQPRSPFSSQLCTTSRHRTWRLSEAEEGVGGREPSLGLQLPHGVRQGSPTF